MSYNLNPKFERQIAVLCASHKLFWLRIGNKVTPDELTDPTNQTLVKLAKAVAVDHNNPTEDLVCQRASLWMSEGKLDEQTVLNIGEALAAQDGEVDIDATVTELVEPVRRHMMQGLVSKAVERYGNGSKFGDLVDLMAACDALGAAAADIETKASEIGEDSELLLECSTRAEQMPTGICELDSEFGGGLPCGTLTTTLMDSKAGKSVWLCQKAAVASMHGEDVAYLSMELPREEIHRRIIAATLGIPINDLLNPKLRAEALRVYKHLRQSGKVGKVIVEKFEQQAINEKEVVAWFDRQEKEHNTRFRYRVMDYGDLIASSKREDRESEYGRGKTVWTALYNMAAREEAPNWVVTATQSKRPESRPGQVLPMLTRKDVADSVHKYRLSDFFLTATPQPDMKASDGYLWYIDADRYYGRTGTVLGPIPHSRHMSRMSDVSYLGK